MKLKNETLRAFYARTMNTQDRKVLNYRDLDRFARFNVAVRRYARKGGAL